MLIDGGKFKCYPGSKRICWLMNGNQYVVEPFQDGYLATFVNGYTSEVIERITFQKRQHSAMYACQQHFEKAD